MNKPLHATWLSSAIALLLGAPASGSDLAGALGGCAGTVAERVIDADPSTYQAAVATLQPGDRLRLAAGTYANGLTLHDLAGEPGRCIEIAGPETGPPARFTGRDCCNTVSLANASYLVIRDLEIDGMGRLGDAVKAEGTADFVHHVTLENLFIHGQGANQQIVGINTKCPAWNLVVRKNVIEGAGTGMYFGNSNGDDTLSNSLIEHNVVTETLGYNLQIKHQNQRETGLGAPAQGMTVIRHNVLSKDVGSNGGDDARPNLLLGHWPLAGAGADDDHLIYGNFFHQNPTEALVQAEGNVSLYSNLLLNDDGPAVHIQPHNDVPRRVRITQNTVVATGRGIRVTGGAAGFSQQVVGNAVFAGTPLAGGDQADNVVDTYAAAATYLVNPDGALVGSADRLDLFPLLGALSGSGIDLSGIVGHADADRDWNGRHRPSTFRGAYAGEGMNPGWTLALARKPELTIFADGFESGDTSGWSATEP